MKSLSVASLQIVARGNFLRERLLLSWVEVAVGDHFFELFDELEDVPCRLLVGGQQHLGLRLLLEELRELVMLFVVVELFGLIKDKGLVRLAGIFDGDRPHHLLRLDFVLFAQFSSALVLDDLHLMFSPAQQRLLVQKLESPLSALD